MLVISETADILPYAMGDGLMWGLGTDLATYGASHVGMMAAVVETTHVEKILQLDLLATDFYHDTAYPTFLYYNPYAAPQAVQVDVGQSPVDIYDTVSQGMLAVNVSGMMELILPPDAAVVAVLAPAGGAVTLDGTRKKIDGVIVDYKTNTAFNGCAQIQASPQRLSADVNGDCIVDTGDLAVMAEQWLATGPALGRVDMVADDAVNLSDAGVLAAQWLMEN